MDQANQTIMITGIIAASSGLLGAIIGSVVGPLVSSVLDRRRQDSILKKEAARQQLEIYRPLYEKLIIMPDQDPEHYFSEWEEDEFSEWLSKAVDLMLPNLHLLSNEMLSKIHSYRESLANPAYDCEADVRWLYTHIQNKFESIRKELKIE